VQARQTCKLGSAQIDEVTTDNPDIAQAALLEAIHPQLVAHFQPALVARFQTLAYRPLDVGLRRQHDVDLLCEDLLICAMAELCVARESGARNVDAFLNQRILPTVSRELLTRMASGKATARIILSSSAEGSLTIDFIDRGEAVGAVPKAMAI